MKAKTESEVVSRVQLFATPWPAAYQAPPSTGFSRQEYWSGVPLPSPILNTTPWTTAHQAPLSMGFSRQEYWGGLTFPPPGYRPDTGIEPMFLAAPGLTGILFTTEPPKKPPIRITIVMS